MNDIAGIRIATVLVTKIIDGLVAFLLDNGGRVFHPDRLPA